MDNFFSVESFSKNNAPIHSQNLFVISKHMIQWNAINKRIFVHSLLFYLSIILSTASSETTTTRRRQWFSPVQNFLEREIVWIIRLRSNMNRHVYRLLRFLLHTFSQISEYLKRKTNIFCVIARGAPLFIDEKLLTALKNKFSKEMFTL